MARQRRDEVLSQQPAEADRAAAAGQHRQGALVVRAGAPAAQAGTGARRFRRPLLDRSASARADDLHRLCLAATPAPEGCGAGEKSWRPTGRRRSHRCLRSAAPSSPSCSLRLRFPIVARTATGGFFNTLPKCQSSAMRVSAQRIGGDTTAPVSTYMMRNRNSVVSQPISEDTIRDNYAYFQYHLVEFVTEHLIDLSQTLRRPSTGKRGK